MAYEKRTWVSGTTPLSAENMNHMEEGIAAANEGVDKLNTDIVRIGSLILIASSSEAKWIGKTTTANISNFKSICLIVRDPNNSIYSQAEIPVDVFKTCNSAQKTICAARTSTVESYSYYSNETTIGLYVSSSGFAVEAYGRY